jgi:hypothetical protein
MTFDSSDAGEVKHLLLSTPALCRAHFHLPGLFGELFILTGRFYKGKLDESLCVMTKFSHIASTTSTAYVYGRMLRHLPNSSVNSATLPTLHSCRQCIAVSKVTRWAIRLFWRFYSKCSVSTKQRSLMYFVRCLDTEVCQGTRSPMLPLKSPPCSEM